MKKYKVDVTFIFKGTVEIETPNKEQAKEQIEDGIGLVLGGSVHTTLDDETVDWEFDCHPDKKIGKVKLIQ